MPQSAYYNAQQYSQYPQTSNYYHPGNSYGYGQNAAAAAYQQGTGYGAGNSSYGGQGNKYAGGYGATGEQTPRSFTLLFNDTSCSEDMTNAFQMIYAGVCTVRAVAQTSVSRHL